MKRIADRFDRRLTVVIGGAGFGKTTLLGHGIEENELDPRGVDVWVDINADGLATHGLAAMTMGALLEQAPPDTATIDDVVDHVWQRAPVEVALVFDNVHRSGDVDGIGGDFTRLLVELPGNGHVVIASRLDPPMPFRRLLASGEAELISEADLAFTRDELEAFAELRSVDEPDLGRTGWPALAELRATAGSDGAREYIAEEVLSGLEPVRLASISRLATLGWFDDELVAAVTDFEGSAAELAQGLPLTSRSEGRIELHDLWPTWLPQLTVSEKQEACLRLGDALKGRGELPAAFAMYVGGHHYDVAEQVLRSIAVDYGLHYPLAARRQMLAAMPRELVATPAARLLEADVGFISYPQTCGTALEAALNVAKDAGDAELMAHAILRQSELLYQSHNGLALEAKLDELAVIESRDPVPVGAIRAIVKIWYVNALDRLEEVTRIASGPEVARYEPVARHAPHYIRAAIAHSGHCEEALGRIRGSAVDLRGRHRARSQGLETILVHQTGQMNDERRADARRLVASIRAAGHSHLFAEGAATVAIYHLTAADIGRGRSLLAEAKEVANDLGANAWGLTVIAIGEAMLAVLDGDETRAVDLIDAVMPAGGPFDGLARHIFYNAPALVYVLNSRSREAFNAHPVGPQFLLARRVAHALVALREQGDPEPAAELPWNDLHLLRVWAVEPHLAELAIAASTRGVAGAEIAIKELQHEPHRILSQIEDRYDGPVGLEAARILSSTPRRPSVAVRVEALGPLRVTVGSTTYAASKLRSRVVDMLELLVAHRSISRIEILQLLWPDLDEKRARNNLRVTLSHLVALLEPERVGSVPP